MSAAQIRDVRPVDASGRPRIRSGQRARFGAVVAAARMALARLVDRLCGERSS